MVCWRGHSSTQIAAGKTLFLLRRYACPPWDDAIRKYVERDGCGTGYGHYLRVMRRLLRQLADEAGVPVSELPRVVERNRSTPVEVIDDCLWRRRLRRTSSMAAPAFALK